VIFSPSLDFIFRFDDRFEYHHFFVNNWITVIVFAKIHYKHHTCIIYKAQNAFIAHNILLSFNFSCLHFESLGHRHRRHSHWPLFLSVMSMAIGRLCTGHSHLILSTFITASLLYLHIPLYF
jgi:hypothetical protein